MKKEKRLEDRVSSGKGRSNTGKALLQGYIMGGVMFLGAITLGIKRCAEYKGYYIPTTIEQGENYDERQ